MNAPQFTALDAFQAIWNRKFTVASFLIGTVLLVGLVTLMIPKEYISDARMFVRLGRENTSLDVTAGLGDKPFYSMPLTRDAEMNSIAEMIQNKELYGKVVDRVSSDRILKKQARYDADGNVLQSVSFMDGVKSVLQGLGLHTKIDPREKAIIYLQKRVDVQVSDKSNVVGVGIQTYDPQLAQDIIKTIVEEYQLQHNRINRTQGSDQFLEQQTAEFERTLKDTERRFEEFKTRTRLISVEDQRKVLVDRIAKIKTEMLDTEAAIESTQSELEKLKEVSAGLSELEMISQKEGAGNEGIDGMRQELFRLQVKREELLAIYPETSPKVIAVEEQLAAAQKIFDATEAQMVEAVEGPSKLFQDASLDLIRLEPKLASLETKIATLETQLAEELENLAEFNANETEFLRLNRALQIDDENYRRYTRSLQQATMDHSLEESNLSNLSIFQAASFNPKPSSPDVALNLLGGFALGIMGGCALAVLLEYRDRLSDRSESLESALELPVVSTIPRQSRRTLIRTN